MNNYNRKVTTESIAENAELVELCIKLFSNDFHYAEDVAKTALGIKSRRAGKMRKGAPRKLTFEQAEEIRDLAEQGEISKRAIAAKFGVSPQVVYMIINGRSYKQS